MSSIVRGGSGDPPARALEPSSVTWIPAVEFKLAEHYPTPDPPESLALASLIPAGHGLHAIVPALRVESVFDGATADLLRGLVDRAQRIDPGYHPPRFANVLRVRTPDVQSAHLLTAALRANSAAVDFAEVQRVVPLPGVTPYDDPLQAQQVQHDAPRKGINARGAWALGADGAGATLVDLERGLDPHDDLPAFTLVYGDAALIRNLGAEHGTAVLGIVAGTDNQHGGIGIAPAVRLGFAMRYWGVVTDDRIGHAIKHSLSKLQYGDILLIDDQYGLDIGGSVYAMPIELHPVVDMLLGLIDLLGVVLVEPAGNGSSSIDPYCLPASGAVIVGGINPATFKREAVEHQSNFGTRVDCHAPYGNIVTSGWDADLYGAFPDAGPQHSATAYTKSFRGTSATAAIVAGAACLIQSYLAKFFGYRLAPQVLRDLLRTSGLPSLGAADQVGVMPDAEACILSVARPISLLIREGQGDDGRIPRPPWGNCPDILVYAHPLPLTLPPPPLPPLPAPSEPGGSLDLSPLAQPPAGAYIYVRAHSLEGASFTGAFADVYAAPPAFLPMAHDWSRIGSARIGELPGNGTPRTSVVPLFLAADKIRRWGGASLIAVLGTERQPPPSPHGIRDAEEVQRFFESNRFVGVLTRLAPKPPRPGQDLEEWQTFEFPVGLPAKPRGRPMLGLAHTFSGPVTVTLTLPVSNVRLPAGAEVSGLHAAIEIPSGDATKVEMVLDPGQRIRCRLDVRAPAGRRLPAGSFAVVQKDGVEDLAMLGGEVLQAP